MCIHNTYTYTFTYTYIGMHIYTSPSLFGCYACVYLYASMYIYTYIRALDMASAVYETDRVWA